MGSKNEKRNRKKMKMKESSNGEERRGKMITDSRFSSLHSDPRFQKNLKHKAKVGIDSRFGRMFTEKNFSSSSNPLEKRGLVKDQESENPLRNYYRFDEEDEIGSQDDCEEAEEEIGSPKLEKRRRSPSESESSRELEVAEPVDEDEVKGGDSESTTDTDESDDEVYIEEEDEAKEEAIPVIEKETKRLAVVNMDWKHVQATDLYVMLSSCLPKGGQILSVTVYPSEYGLQRMQEEEVHGPVGLFDDENDQDAEDDDNEIDDEKLREYEKSRLRYYYAVVDCDSIATADYLYKSCDGIEFERSSNVLDLRFIPDSMEFKHPPRDVATEVPANYEGLDFQTQALQQSKIHLSWDEDEPRRVKTLKRKFDADQLAELELKEFLASDESESEDDEKNNATEDGFDGKPKKRDMYRALIESNDGSDGDGEENDQDMEVTFNTGLEELSKHILEKKDKKSESVWDAYLRKRREKKKARKNKSNDSSEDDTSDTDQEAVEEPDDFFVEEPSVKGSKKEGRVKRGREEKQQQDTDREAEASRAELELLLADENGADTGIKGYNLKSKKKTKGKKGKEVPDEDKLPTVDYDETRFSSLFTSPLFALDPTDPQFKRSAAYARQVAEKQRMSNREELLGKKHMNVPTRAHVPSDDPQCNKDERMKSEAVQAKKEKYELSSLVRSIKLKAKQVQSPSDEKMSKKDKKLHSRNIPEKRKEDDLSKLVQSVKKKTKHRK